MAKTWTLLIFPRFISLLSTRGCYDFHFIGTYSSVFYGKISQSMALEIPYFTSVHQVRVESACLINRLDNLESDFDALQVLKLRKTTQFIMLMCSLIVLIVKYMSN